MKELQAREVIGHSHTIHGMEFSPSCELLATSSADKTLRLWDVRTWKTMSVLNARTPYTRAIAFSRDGSLLAVAEWERVVVYEVVSGREVHQWLVQETAGPVGELKFSDDGITLGGLSWEEFSDNSRVFLWNLAHGDGFAMEVDGLATAMWFGESGSMVVETYDAEDGVRRYRVCNLTAQEVLVDLDLRACCGGGIPLSSPNRALLALGNNCFGSPVQLLSLTGRTLWSRQAAEDATPAIAFAPDARSVAVAVCDVRRLTCTLSLVDALCGADGWVVPNVPAVDRLLFCHGGRLLSGVSAVDRCARFWDVSDGQLRAEAGQHHAACLISPDDKWLVSGGTSLRVTDLADVERERA